MDSLRSRGAAASAAAILSGGESEPWESRTRRAEGTEEKKRTEMPNEDVKTNVGAGRSGRSFEDSRDRYSVYIAR